MLFVFYLRRNATGKDLPPSDLDGMMNGLLEDRQRTPLLVIGGRPHPSHSRTWFRPKLIFLIFLSYCEQGNFKTNIIERDAYDSLPRCNFRYIGIAKRKKKGLRVLKKGFPPQFRTIFSDFFIMLLKQKNGLWKSISGRITIRKPFFSLWLAISMIKILYIFQKKLHNDIIFIYDL